MKDYKRGSHTLWDCKYHLVWVTKYRCAVLVGDVGLRCRELLREIARSQGMEIYAGSINRDPVHLLIGVAPQLSVSRAVQFLKGKSSHKLLSKFLVLRKRYWSQHLLALGYWVASSGNMTDEVWKKYIQEQKSGEPDDGFRGL
jgi:putative transposase